MSLDKFYVVNEHFKEVDDVFLGMFWAFGKNGGIKGTLEKSPKRTELDNPAKAVEYFNHINVYLSPELIEYDRIAHASRYARHLQEALQSAHRDHFLKLTAAGEEIRYRILPGQSLSSREVRISFGRCIYIPAANEKPLYQLNFYNDEEEIVSLSVPVFYQQRLLLINGDFYGAQAALENWPFQARHSILILQNEANELEVLSEPVGALSIKNIQDEHYCISDKSGNKLNLKLTSLRKRQTQRSKQEQRPENWGSIEDDKERALDLASQIGKPLDNSVPSHDEKDERTFIMSENTASSITLELVGLPLLRLSNFPRNRFKELRIGFSADGQIISLDDDRIRGVIVLDVDDNLFIEHGGVQEKIELPYQWSLANGLQIEIDQPPPTLVQYIALLRLANPITFQLPKGVSQIFGRGENAQIAPSLLNEAQVIMADQKSDSAEKMGFSREAAIFKSDDNGLYVQQKGGNPLWRLNKLGEIIKIDTQGLYLQADEYLLYAHYLFRIS